MVDFPEGDQIRVDQHVFLRYGNAEHETPRIGRGDCHQYLAAKLQRRLAVRSATVDARLILADRDDGGPIRYRISPTAG